MVVKLEEGKTTHQCVMLFPTSFKGRPNAEMEIPEFASVGVENYCGPKLIIETLKIAKEVKKNGKTTIETWEPSMPLLLKKNDRFLLTGRGIPCEVSGGMTSSNILKSLFATQELVPIACSTVVLNNNNGVHLEIPGYHGNPEGHLFRITGKIDGKPYVGQARILDRTFSQ